MPSQRPSLAARAQRLELALFRAPENAFGAGGEEIARAIAVEFAGPRKERGRRRERSAPAGQRGGSGRA